MTVQLGGPPGRATAEPITDTTTTEKNNMAGLDGPDAGWHLVKVDVDLFGPRCNGRLSIRRRMQLST